jgi:hypothetical protein
MRHTNANADSNTHADTYPDAIADANSFTDTAVHRGWLDSDFPYQWTGGETRTHSSLDRNRDDRLGRT